MKHTSPLESPNNLFTQSQASKNLSVPKAHPNVVRNLGLNFEELMPTQSLPTSPNFQKMSDILQSPSFQGSKPVSIVLPEQSQNSWIIPLQDHLETSMPFEDLIGSLESPKLSDKMQMIFNSNVNLSESIMKNTFRAVDESRVKLDDKDLQVELEISELKLHHLEKRVEGCLASSKNTLAMNAQLSQNVSKLVSPAKSSQGFFSTNIKTRANSRSNTPRGNPEDFAAQLPNNRREVREDLSSSRNRPKSLTPRISDVQYEANQRANQQEREFEYDTGNNILVRNLLEVEKEKSLNIEKRVKSASVSVNEPNVRLKDSIINEAYQKLNSYFGPGDTRKAQNQETEAIKAGGCDSPSKSTEILMSNNITFYTNLPERDAHIETEEHTKNLNVHQSNDYLSEDQEHSPKQTYLFSSKSRENAAVLNATTEPRVNTMPREVSLVDADGKERIFILKPKEPLRIERLESIFVIPLGNRPANVGKAKVRSQFSSFQGSETEEGSQIKENLRHVDHTLKNDQAAVGSQSRVSFFDNSNVASMNLDKPETRLSGFVGQPHQESQGAAGISFQSQKEAYLNNLRLQIVNHPKCQKFFASDDNITVSTRGRSVDVSSKDNDGMEFYFKQKIHDFREFLNEFERILPTEVSMSPTRESLIKPKKVQQVKSFEFSNKQNINKESAFEYGGLEPKTVENTPREYSNESHEYVKDTNMRKSGSLAGYLVEQSPQSSNPVKKNKPVRFENNEVEQQQLKENLGSPLSGGKTNFGSTKSSFFSNGEPLKKKSTKAVKPGTPKEGLSISVKTIKLNKVNKSIAIPVSQSTEKKKTHDKSSSMKSFSQAEKIKKPNEETYGNSEVKKKKEKNIARGSSKSIVEVVNLGKIPQRANSVYAEK